MAAERRHNASQLGRWETELGPRRMDRGRCHYHRRQQRRTTQRVVVVEDNTSHICNKAQKCSFKPADISPARLPNNCFKATMLMGQCSDIITIIIITRSYSRLLITTTTDRRRLMHNSRSYITTTDQGQHTCSKHRLCSDKKHSTCITRRRCTMDTTRHNTCSSRRWSVQKRTCLRL